MALKTATRGAQRPLHAEFIVSFNDTMVDVNGVTKTFGSVFGDQGTFEIVKMPVGARIVGANLLVDGGFAAWLADDPAVVGRARNCPIHALRADSPQVHWQCGSMRSSNAVTSAMDGFCGSAIRAISSRNARSARRAFTGRRSLAQALPMARIFFCGCRSVCKDFLNVWTCDRVRTFVRPVRAADMAPLAGMVMRGPGPNLQRRARGSEKVSGFPDPDHVDHVPIQIMTSSQLGGPSANSTPVQAPISTGPR